MKLWTAAAAALVAIGSTAAAQPPPARIVMAPVSAPLPTPSPETFRSLTRFGDALQIVERVHVTPIDSAKAIDSALAAMIAGLDPHSSYLSPEEFAALKGIDPRTSGSLGLALTKTAAGMVVVRTEPDSPAARAGIAPDDVVWAVDGRPVSDLDLDGAIAALKGPLGSLVNVEVRRAGTTLKLEFHRERIVLHTVNLSMRGDVAIVRISSLSQSTASDLEAELASLAGRRPRPTGMVLDLRNNPGGLLETAVAVASDFLDGGVVMSQRGRAASDLTVYRGRPSGDLTHGTPLAVLVNRGTGAGAEVIAGALQDRGRARIVGLPTFGNGSVQTVIPLKQGGAIKITTSLLYTPNGRAFQQVGILPDIQVAASQAEVERGASALSEQGLKGALPAATGATVRRTTAPPETPPPGFDPAHDDYQLVRAMELLRAPQPARSGR